MSRGKKQHNHGDKKTTTTTFDDNDDHDDDNDKWKDLLLIRTTWQEDMNWNLHAKLLLTKAKTKQNKATPPHTHTGWTQVRWIEWPKQTLILRWTSLTWTTANNNWKSLSVFFAIQLKLISMMKWTNTMQWNSKKSKQNAKMPPKHNWHKTKHSIRRANGGGDSLWLWRKTTRDENKIQLSNVNSLKHWPPIRFFIVVAFFTSVILLISTTDIWLATQSHVLSGTGPNNRLQPQLKFVACSTVDFIFAKATCNVCVCEWALAQVFEYSMCNKWLYFMHVWTDVGATRIEIDREMFSATFEKDSDVGISFFWGR